MESAAKATPQQMAALQSDLFRWLHDAVVKLGKKRILALIERIKAIDAHLASALNTCIQ